MKRNSIKERLCAYFFEHPTVQLRVRQIERAVQIPLPSARRYAGELVQENILKRVAVSTVVFFAADRSSKEFLFEKMLYNLRQVHASGLIEYLVQEISNPPIVLFGSYSRGEDIEDSDIDLYVETVSNKNLHLGEFEMKLKRHIQIFRYKRITQVKNSALADNIMNGITLNGFIEVFV